MRSMWRTPRASSIAILKPANLFLTKRGPAKIRGSCGASASFSLSHLQLGRARALARDNTGARTAYQDFLALWKDADPDIPILKEAQAEYAKQQ
jgi:hypothetical protein